MGTEPPNLLNRAVWWTAVQHQLAVSPLAADYRYAVSKSVDRRRNQNVQNLLTVAETKMTNSVDRRRNQKRCSSVDGIGCVKNPLGFKTKPGVDAVVHCREVVPEPAVQSRHANCDITSEPTARRL